jgi:multiple sugar transport system substrate-binding protein
MNNLKRLCALIFAFVIALSMLTGCHGRLVTDTAVGEGEPLPTLPDKFDESKSHEVVFWAKNDTNKTQIEVYQKAISDFHALYPNVTVKLRLYTDYTRLFNDVITNINTDTTPNVCITYPDHIATYITGEDVVEPLDGFFTDEKFGLGGSELKFDTPTQEEIVPQFLAECVLNGRHYAIPFMRSTEACYVNKTMVESLGFELPETLTWDFVWQVSEAATAKNADGTYKVNGQKVMIPFIYKSTDNMMIQMLRQKGAGYSDESGRVLLFNDTARKILETVGEHAKSGAFDTFKHISYPANFLNAGQCIFAVDSTAGATWMGCDAPLLDIPEDQLVEFETAVRAVPQFDPQNPKMISQGPSICVFRKDDPQEVLASWLFAQFLLTNGVQMGYAETEGHIPVTQTALNDPAYQDYLSRAGEDNDEHYAVKLAASRLLMNNTANTFITPVFNGSASVRNAAGQLIESVNKDVRRRAVINDKYIDSLYSEIIALYRLDNVVLDGSQNEDGFGGEADTSADLGPLPAGSAALLTTLAVVWIIIGAAAIYNFLKNKRAARLD